MAAIRPAALCCLGWASRIQHRSCRGFAPLSSLAAPLPFWAFAENGYTTVVIRINFSLKLQAVISCIMKPNSVILDIEVRSGL